MGIHKLLIPSIPDVGGYSKNGSKCDKRLIALKGKQTGATVNLAIASLLGRIIRVAN